MCCLNSGHAKSHPLSHCLLPWYDAFVVIFCLQPLTWFSLATIIAYDLICRAFSIIIFFLFSINRSSFAFGLFCLCEFGFALRVLAYFILYFHVFPVPCWWTISVPTQLSISYGMLYLFKSTKTELAQILWIFSHEYLHLSSLLTIYHNTWIIFCLLYAGISPAM